MFVVLPLLTVPPSLLMNSLTMLSIQVLAVRDKLPDLRAIVQYGQEEVEHDGVVSWEEFQVDYDDHTDPDNDNLQSNN